MAVPIATMQKSGVRGLVRILATVPAGGYPQFGFRYVLECVERHRSVPSEHGHSSFLVALGIIIHASPAISYLRLEGFGQTIRADVHAVNALHRTSPTDAQTGNAANQR